MAGQDLSIPITDPTTAEEHTTSHRSMNTMMNINRDSLTSALWKDMTDSGDRK